MSILKTLCACTVALSLMVLTGCSTLADAKAGKGTGESRVFNAKAERVWNILPQAVKANGLDFVADNKAEGYALAQRGISAFSYGENVALFVDQAGDEKTKVEVVSKKAMATNIFAPNWAKSILDKIEELLK